MHAEPLVNSRSRSLQFAAATLVASSCGGIVMGSSDASLQGVNLSILVNGEDPVVYHGAAALSGTHIDPQDRWTVSWNYTLNSDPSDTGSLVGKATFWNTSGNVATFNLVLSSPICPIIVDQSMMGGALNLKLFAGNGGAQVQSVGEVPVFAVLADGSVGGTIFDAPFALGGGGGFMSTNGSFGSPFPSQPAPPVEDAAAMRLHFSMTDGDVAEFNTSFYFGAEPESIVECSDVLGDLNGNGKVGIGDLLILLSSWGPCDGCAADLNGDGNVGVADMIILLINWG